MAIPYGRAILFPFSIEPDKSRRYKKKKEKFPLEKYRNNCYRIKSDRLASVTVNK